MRVIEGGKNRPYIVSAISSDEDHPNPDHETELVIVHRKEHPAMVNGEVSAIRNIVAGPVALADREIAEAFCKALNDFHEHWEEFDWDAHDMDLPAPIFKPAEDHHHSAQKNGASYDPCASHQAHGIHLDPCCPHCPDPEASKPEPDWNYEGAMADLDGAITVLIKRINGEADTILEILDRQLADKSRRLNPETPKAEQEPAAWRVRCDGAVHRKRKEAQAHVDGWRRQGATCDDPQPLFDHPAPATDELLDAAEYAVERFGMWKAPTANMEEALELLRDAIAKHKGPQS